MNYSSTIIVDHTILSLFNEIQMIKSIKKTSKKNLYAETDIKN